MEHLFREDAGAPAPPPPPPPQAQAATDDPTKQQQHQHRLQSLIMNGHDQVMGHASVYDHDDYDMLDKTQRQCEHDVLKSRPLLWAAVGVIQTFLTAIMFGWASLVPVIKAEMMNDSNNATNAVDLEPYTPTQMSQIFTCGAVGNYLATLPFGILLDVYGPRICGIVASIIYALGLFLCGFDTQNFYCFAVGFGLVGLSRPGIQMPTLHLANLFEGSSGKGKKGGGTGGALYMSAQAAAFDAGTAIFALMNVGYFQFGLKSGTMFWMYMVVPLWTLLTAIWVWPNETLERESEESSTAGTAGDNSDDEHEKFIVIVDDGFNEMDSLIGSPYLSRKQRKQLSNSQRLHQDAEMAAAFAKAKSSPNLRRFWNEPHPSLVNAPLKQVLTHVSFYALSTWVGIHIYKLNFIVATINDQLLRHFDSTDQEANSLIDVLGAMLPFGFVVLPIVASLLHHQPMFALQVANVVGIIYGAVMVWFPGYKWLQILVVFPAVATSRQLVYSTLFHTIAKVFGFSNYGVLLGLTNAIASLFQTLQTPMVNWSENQDSYFWSNWVLWASTIPLLFTVLYSDPVWTPAWNHFCCGADSSSGGDDDDPEVASETSKLLAKQSANPRDTTMMKGSGGGGGGGEDGMTTVSAASTTTTSSSSYASSSHANATPATAAAS